jgi:nucleoside-diphosphate-sugar epimerase
MTKLIVGCGYLGQRVAALWRDQRHQVFAGTRQAPPPPAYHELDLSPVPCDVLDPESLKNLPRADTVLYAVGFDRSSGATMRAVYVDGLAHVLERLPPPEKFIYISSSSVYGQTDGDWVDEVSVTLPQEETGRIVLEAEKVLRQKRPDAVILRFSGIYGPGRLLRRKTIEAGEPIVGDGSKWLNLIHVEDGARAILAAEEHAQPGRIYNVCDSHPVQRRDFYAEMARLLEAPEPRFILALEGTPTPPHEKGNRRIANKRLREELGVEFRFPDYRQGLRGSL